jgi:hypothetical protein
VTTTSAFAIDSDVMHSSCWSVLVASVGTVPSLYRTSLDLYLSVYIDGAVNGIWLPDIHWALSQNCEKRLSASSGPPVRVKQLDFHWTVFMKLLFEFFTLFKTNSCTSFKYKVVQI